MDNVYGPNPTPEELAELQGQTIRIKKQGKKFRKAKPVEQQVLAQEAFDEQQALIEANNELHRRQQQAKKNWLKRALGL